MHTRIKSAILALARATPEVEICGFIYADPAGHAQLLPCRNIAADPAAAFEIDVQDHILALNTGPLLGLWHSHPGPPAGFSRGNPEAGIMGDLDWAEELGLPLYLANVEDGSWHTYLPASYQPPLEGRAWTLGFSDCWETPRLHFRAHHGLLMADYDRDESFSHEEAGTILANYAREGFTSLPPDPAALRPHDILLFRTDRALPQHFGVFLGPRGMLHHPQGALSRVETLTSNWQRRLTHVFRHRTLA